jgi:hypothetical protein
MVVLCLMGVVIMFKRQYYLPLALEHLCIGCTRLAMAETDIVCLESKKTEHIRMWDIKMTTVHVVFYIFMPEVVLEVLFLACMSRFINGHTFVLQ